ncbi:MAG: glycosyltransferase family 4 protein [Bacteroidota bacterium]
MRVLQLCKKFPYPLKDGESIAVSYLAKGLKAKGADLALLVMNTTKHYFDIQQYPAVQNPYSRILEVPLDNSLKALPAFLNLFTGASYHLSRYDFPAYHQQLRALLVQETYDLILLETFYLSPYVATIRKHSKATILMRSHNVEHEIWERIHTHTSTGLKSWYIGLQTKRLKQAELQYLNSYDHFLAISTRDLQRFQTLGLRLPADVLPIGIDLKDFSFSLPGEGSPRKVGFIGSLDWMPNLEGLEWFLREVWPIVLATRPEMECHIAGRNCPDHLKTSTKEQVIVHGEVADAHAFVKACDISIVPLLSGSGMRVKILESMALGTPVVSTGIGIEGIPATDQESAYIRDKAPAFAKAILDLCRHPEQMDQMAILARQMIETHFDNQLLADRVYQQFNPKTGVA